MTKALSTQYDPAGCNVAVFSWITIIVMKEENLFRCLYKVFQTLEATQA